MERFYLAGNRVKDVVSRVERGTLECLGVMLFVGLVLARCRTVEWWAVGKLESFILPAKLREGIAKMGDFIL